MPASRGPTLSPIIFDDTIAAISTAPGAGAIAIVRLSGKDASRIARQIFVAGKKTANRSEIWTSHFAMHGYIKDIETEILIDEVVVIPYKGPNSYTGEDLIEIDCHGGAVVTNEILNLCLRSGARLARAGEFTQRAFLHGRMDLTQAEAVYDLIQAKTSRQSRLAVSALTGELGQQIRSVRNKLLELLSRVVAGIDFPEEVGDTPLDDILTILADALEKLQCLAATARTGRFLREGLRLAIVGKPNAGKSSLLNQLLQFERAIVTDIPGTTRDSLEELLDMNGIPVILTDTAGIRTTDDRVEKIGIERSRNAVEQADLVLFLCDLNSPWTKDDQLILEMIGPKPFVTLGNKMDLQPAFTFDNPAGSAQASLSKKTGPGSDLSPGHSALALQTVDAESLLEATEHALARIVICAKTGENLQRLTDLVSSWVVNEKQLQEVGGSLNLRQSELCEKTIVSINLAQETVQNDMPQDCLATDLKCAVDQLSEVCGETVSEEIIANVFANFCIGK
jgi:tRNA modification GTPase